MILQIKKKIFSNWNLRKFRKHAIDQGKFVAPNEPASAAVSADEAIEAEQIEGFGTLSHIREIAAYQFMGPMPAEVERLKTLNSCLPGLKFP